MAKYRCTETCTYDRKFWKEGQVAERSDFTEKDPKDCPYFEKVGTRKKVADGDEFLE